MAAVADALFSRSGRCSFVLSLWDLYFVALTARGWREPRVKPRVADCQVAALRGSELNCRLLEELT